MALTKAGKAYSTARSAVDSISRWAAVVAGMAVVFMAGANGYEVAARTLFNSPTLWVLEMSEYALIWAVFLGLAYTESISGHIRMELVVDRLRPRSRLLMESIFLVPALGFLAILAWYSGEQAATYFDRVSATILRLWLFPSHMVIPIGSLFLFLRLVIRLIDNIGSLRRDAAEEPKPAEGGH